MRKFLLAILSILILTLAFFFIRDGLELGNFKVLGIYDMQAHANELDTRIEEARQVTESEIKSENDKLVSALKESDTQKEKYETLVEQTDPSDIEEALKKEQYEVEKLWIAVGNYADEHKVVVNMQFTNSTSGLTGVKDINFTINGSYTDITEFIYDLEDDEELTFKIENFKILPDASKSNLKATFSVKDVYINLDDSKISSSIDTNPTGVDPMTTNPTDTNTPNQNAGNPNTPDARETNANTTNTNV